jgi:transcriptional regulator with XRE-family HTH domain
MKKQTITETLRQIIRDSGISKRQLAKETGVDRMSITFFMQGKELHSNNINKLADYFGYELTKKKEAK